MTLRSRHPNPVEKTRDRFEFLIAAVLDLFVVLVEIYQQCLIRETCNSDLKDTWVGATTAILPSKGSTHHRSGSTAGTWPGGAAPFPSGFAYGVIEAI